MTQKETKQPKKDEFTLEAEKISKEIAKLKTTFEKDAESYSDLELIMNLAQDKKNHIDRANEQPLIYSDYKQILDKKLEYYENSKQREFETLIKAKKQLLFNNFKQAGILSAKIEVNHKELEKRLGLTFEFSNNGYMMSYIALLLLSKNSEMRMGA